MSLISALFRQFTSSFGLFGKYKIILHSLRNRTEKLAFWPVSIARTNKYYTFRQFMYVVYIFNLLCFAMSYFHFIVIWCFIVVFHLSGSWRFLLFSLKESYICINYYFDFMFKCFRYVHVILKSHTALVIKEWLLFNANSAIFSYIMARTS